MRKPEYQQLSGRSYGLRGIGSLWLGDGHLLEVVAILPVERYRRWYLRDIQALVARRSWKRIAWNLVWGIASGIALSSAAGLIGLAAVEEMGPGQVALYTFGALSGAIGVVSAVLVLVNTVLGPTCTVYLQTPRALVTLSAPTRERGFRRLVAQLRPVLELAQRPPATEAAPSAIS